jgi:Agrobacterium tumefaciens protein Atu4866
MMTPESTATSAQPAHPYTGMWVTQDLQVRHELLPNGRYVEARGTRERAYLGRYEVTGDHIEYWDDTGFTADGDFRENVLYHGGMVLRRAPQNGSTSEHPE